MNTNNLDTLHHITKLGNLLDNTRHSRKKLIGYANHTNVFYNIVTNKNYNEYYKSFQSTLPYYIRDQHKWSTSRKVLNDNRNTSLVNKAHSFSQLKNCELKGEEEMLSLLPSIKNHKSSRFIVPLNESRSENRFASVGKDDLHNKSKIVFSRQLMKRAMQLGRFVNTIKTAQGKSLINNHAKKLLLKLRNKSQRQKESERETLESAKGIIKYTLGIPSTSLDNNKHSKSKTNEQQNLNEMTKR